MIIVKTLNQPRQRMNHNITPYRVLEKHYSIGHNHIQGAEL